MTTPELLPKSLVWESDGHLSEVALTALADGQDAIVPTSAHAHVATCERCSLSLAEVALMSLDTGAALLGDARAMPARAMAAEPVKARAKVPFGAIGLALVVAVIGALPRLIGAEGFVNRASHFVAEAPLYMKSALAIVREPSVQRALTVASFFATVVLMVLGLWVARRASAAGFGSSNEGVS